MKKVFLLFAVITMALSACNSKAKDKDAQADPRSVAEAIFDAAKDGKYDGLAALVDTDADKDSKMIADVATNKELEKMFKEYFSTGKVVGEPTITGDNAEVKILFGPDGTKEETFNMVRKNGKWYLNSF